jgi:hypothetical protein
LSLVDQGAKERYERPSSIGLVQVRETPELLGLAAGIRVVAACNDDDRKRGAVRAKPAQEFQPRHALQLQVEKEALRFHGAGSQILLSGRVTPHIETAGPENASKRDAFVCVVFDDSDG